MKISLQEIINDLVNQPGLGMFAWFCFITFLIALVFFIWALKSGQLNDLEQSKFDMFDNERGQRTEDRGQKEVDNNG